MEACEAACVQSTGAINCDCRARGTSDISATRRAGRNVIAVEVRRAFSPGLTVKVVGEAAAARHFQDSDLAAAREAVAGRFEAEAVVVVAAVGAVGLERCDQARACHRTILPRL